jgi:Protein of unknown function (DUF3325)
MLPDLDPILAVTAAMLLSFGGFAALASAMARHRAQLTIAALTKASATNARLAGAALLAAALGACIAGWGVSVGFVGWACAISIAAMALIYLLPYAPKLTRTLAYAAPIAGAVMIGAGILA